MYMPTKFRSSQKSLQIALRTIIINNLFGYIYYALYVSNTYRQFGTYYFTINLHLLFD